MLNNTKQMHERTYYLSAFLAVAAFIILALVAVWDGSAEDSGNGPTFNYHAAEKGDILGATAPLAMSYTPASQTAYSSEEETQTKTLSLAFVSMITMGSLVGAVCYATWKKQSKKQREVSERKRKLAMMLLLTVLFGVTMLTLLISIPTHSSACQMVSVKRGDSSCYQSISEALANYQDPGSGHYYQIVVHAATDGSREYPEPNGLFIEQDQISLQPSGSITITTPEIQINANDCIFGCVASDDSVFSVFGTADKDGITINGDYVEVHHCVVESAKNGIFVKSGSNYFTLKGNRTQNNHRSGIKISESGYLSSTIENNLCNSNGFHGIYLDHILFAKEFSIQNNQCSFNGIHGMYIEWVSAYLGYYGDDGISISNHVSSSNLSDGIHVDTATYLTFNSVTCFGNGSGSVSGVGLYLSRVSSSIFTDIDCQQNTVYGLYLRENSAKNSFTDGFIHNNHLGGIRAEQCYPWPLQIDPSYKTELRNFQVVNNPLFGISVFDSKFFWIEDSTIELTENYSFKGLSVPTHGIVLEGNCYSTKIVNTYIIAFSGFTTIAGGLAGNGIQCTNVQDTTISYNTVRNWYIGINLESAFATEVKNCEVYFSESYGIRISTSYSSETGDSCKIYHNNFVNNFSQYSEILGIDIVISQAYADSDQYHWDSEGVGNWWSDFEAQPKEQGHETHYGITIKIGQLWSFIDYDYHPHLQTLPYEDAGAS